ncbi:hypothetical protein M096_4789 [Parabacteroides distasonis str. 3999B T(B) 6]|nr:hypothetical protein M096_4789 [Parabacteroides distasonis str. 3999B T(B) 6]
MRTKNGDTHTKYRIEKTFHIHIDLKDIRKPGKISFTLFYPVSKI